MKDSHWDYVYCYPNSSVLENKLNITDEKELYEAEREITTSKIYILQEHFVKGNFDLKHLQAIHKFIFCDIYKWAGKLRTVNISKGEMFYRFDYIEQAAADLFNKLKNDNYLMGLSTEEIVKKISFYFGEINVLHPFREGNGRTQRVFIEYLAKAAGYDVDFSPISKNEMINASIRAFDCDYLPMEEMFSKILTPISFSQQYSFVQSITSKNSAVMKAFIDYACVFRQADQQQFESLKKSGINFQCIKKDKAIFIRCSVRDKEMVDNILSQKQKRNNYRGIKL